MREGAQRIIRRAVEAEPEAFLEGYAAERDAQGRRAVVPGGCPPSREVLTGVGPVRVRVPRTREGAGAGRCFRSELLAFYDFPAAHRRSLRTTNPIESTFATIRLRTAKMRCCLSEKTALSLAHQLAMSAEKRWRRLGGFHHLADVRFIDGVEEKETGGRAAGFETAIHNI